MIERVNKLLKLRPGEWKLVLPLLLLLALNILVVELVQVVATAGFVSNVGVIRLPWVWIVDMVALLIFGGLYSLVVDRMKRVNLVAWLMGGFAFFYLVIHLLFTYGIPGGLNYFLLFILADQQFFVFPLAFWALANDVYRVAEAKRLFPVIGVGYAFGSIIGNSLAAGSAAFFSRYGGEPYQLLSLAAFINADCGWSTLFYFP
jgi:AAA family ATP:ADP antiporter